MTIDTDLATLRDELAWQLDYGNRASEHLQDFEEALDRVEAELARLRDVADQRLREGVRQRHRAEAAERELARLREGLRQIIDRCENGRSARRLYDIREKARALLAEDGVA